MSRELQMCVVKTFAMMRTRRDHRNSTKDLGNWTSETCDEGFSVSVLATVCSCE